MEFVGMQRVRSRKRRRHLKKQRREQIKFEVKSAKRLEFISERCNIFISKEKLITDTMQANSFWENYTAAQEWQKRLVYIYVYQNIKNDQNFIGFDLRK